MAAVNDETSFPQKNGAYLWSPALRLAVICRLQPPVPCIDNLLLPHTACFTLKGIWDFEHVERDVPDVSKLGPNE